MTEKRFKEIISTGIVTDCMTGKKYNCEARIDDELLKLLNQFSEENEGLKRTFRDLEEVIEYQKMRINKLDEENKQLQKRVMIFQDKIKGLMK